MPVVGTQPDATSVAIVGGGVAGLAVAARVARDLPGARVTVFERDNRVGGAARTDVIDGYTVDRGPTGFLGSATAIPGVIAELGLEGALETAGEAAGARFLFAGGRLHPVPTGPGSFLSTGLLSPLAKARVLLEPFAPRRPDDVDETIWEFAERRLGREFADTLIAAMVRGVTAGDARASSLAAVFPKMRALEDEHGGLFRALIAKRLAARGRKAAGGGPAGPGGGLRGFRTGGMQRLADALAEAPGVSVATNVGVVGVSTHDGAGRFTLDLSTGASVAANVVVLATPADVTARLCVDLSPTAARELAAMSYAGARIVALGFDRADVPGDVSGFGFLVPPGESVRMLGCQWSSSLFPSQAPAGKVLLRVIGGGTDDPAFVDLSEPEALAVVRRDLQATMGITAAPEFVHQVRWRRAIPQYERGHVARVERIMCAVRRISGLYLAGNAYEGVGLEATVQRSLAVAGEIVDDAVLGVHGQGPALRVVRKAD